MNLVNWTPFRDMDSIFDRYFNQQARLPFRGAEGDLKDLEWAPSADISETKSHYVIKAQLPDVERDDVHVAIENGVLTISGERKFEKEEETETTHRIESMYGKFSRSFTLPTDADESAISAKSRNGMLKVRIPKKAEAKEQPVKISVD